MTVPVPPLVASHPVVKRISDLERKVEALTSQVAQLLWQAPTWNAALTQKAPDTDRYVEFRRIIKAIALMEILADWDLDADDATTDLAEMWRQACAELHRRYGHLQFDGKPLWSQPPTVSDTTKQMVADCLRRRQEA